LKIGVFDSGLGGLTIVDAIIKNFYDATVYYIADTDAAPYGEKSKEEIKKHSLEVTQYLIEKYDIDVLIVACNTATSAAIKEIRDSFKSLIVIGTEPGVKPAINSTKTNSIGVLATPATLRGEKYQELVDNLALKNNIELFEQACPGLVEQIESGEIDSLKTMDMLHNWLIPMKEKNVDTIVLGCTHYPLVGNSIKKIMGEQINLIETGYAIANRLKDLTNISFKDKQKIEVYVYSTGDINTTMIDNILDNWNNGGKIMIRGNN
jgi:glutamate racemase